MVDASTLVCKYILELLSSSRDTLTLTLIYIYIYIYIYIHICVDILLPLVYVPQRSSAPGASCSECSGYTPAHGTPDSPMSEDRVR